MKKTLLILSLTLGAAVPAMADLALATTKNCMGCHAVERRVLGPSYKEIATRYKGDSGASAALAIKIREGGKGVWGPIAMPANRQVSEADAKKLAEWVLSTR